MLKNHLNIALTTMAKVKIGCESINFKKTKNYTSPLKK
jgi:hypothetical protein